ncbi:MAG: Cytochrome c biogenesis ATP-binding export protein CcmA [Hyphomicrobiaceae bacterium hypho_1]
MIEILLKITDLVVKRSDCIVLNNVNVEITSGEAVIVTGPNGVGKTTLLRAIAGYIPIVSGSILMKGIDPQVEISERLHYIGHHNALMHALSVRENLKFWAEFLDEEYHKCGNKNSRTISTDSVETALEFFRLDKLAEQPVAYLSAGQKRRAALARLMVAYRPLWLLDEPTVALDNESVKTLTSLANTHLRNGGLILAATHFPLLFEMSNEIELLWPDKDTDDAFTSGEEIK